MTTTTTPAFTARTIAAAATLRESLALDTLAVNVAATSDAEHAADAARKMLAEASERFGASLLVSAPQVFAWNTPADGAKRGVSFRSMKGDHGVTVSLGGLSYLRHVGHVLALHPEVQTAEGAAAVHALVRKIDDAEVIRACAESKTEDVLALLTRKANAATAERAESKNDAADDASDDASSDDASGTPSDASDAATPTTLDNLAASIAGPAHSIRERIESGEEFTPEAVETIMAAIRDLATAVKIQRERTDAAA